MLMLRIYAMQAQKKESTRLSAKGSEKEIAGENLRRFALPTFAPRNVMFQLWNGSRILGKRINLAP
jgi:hypothetical protein